MKKIILIVLLFMFTSSVTAFAEVVEQCPAAGPCSDGFTECEREILKSDDNGKTTYTEIVQGCCKESCGCPPESGQSQKQSPDGRICCPLDHKFIENADWQACTHSDGCISTYGCCPEDSGGTYVSGYKLCGGEYLPLQTCCPAGEKPIKNMGIDDASGKPIGGCCSEDSAYVSGYEVIDGESLPVEMCCPAGEEPREDMGFDDASGQPIGGCCPVDSGESYIVEVGKGGPQKDCCPKDNDAYPSAVKPGLETCCPEGSVVLAYKGADVCCPAGKPNLHETETSYLCCAAGEQVAKNDQGEEVCCPKNKIVNGICGGDCPEGCQAIVDKGETTCCCDASVTDLPEGATVGTVKKRAPKDDNDE